MKYEYMTVMQADRHEDNDAMLNALGAQGWRLVHTGRVYFRLERAL